MSFNYCYLRALVAEFVAECSVAIETALVLDPRYQADPGSVAIRGIIVALFADLRAGNETRAFRADNLARALDALHAFSIEAVGLGGREGAQFTMAFSPVGHAATEMLVEIARQVDIRTGSAIVPEFRRRQHLHREEMKCLALELEGWASGGENWRARLA